MIDKDVFNYHLQNKNYPFCISTLRNAIKQILIKRIQLKNSHFQYRTIENLKNACFTYLTPIEQEIAIKLYDCSMEEFSETFELNLLLDMYKELKT